MVDPSSLPVALVAELADAEARVLLARRFHNDAVRDTLALRERRPVRLAAAGRNRAAAELFRDRRTRGHRSGPARGRRGRPAHLGAGRAARRRRARCCCSAGPIRRSVDGAAPRWWFTVGGQAQPGERLVDSRRAGDSPRRPGCASSPAEMVGPGVAARRGDRLQRLGDPQRGDATSCTAPAGSSRRRAGAPPWNCGYIHGHRWCDAADDRRSWSRAARRCTRCSSVSCSPRPTRWPTSAAAGRAAELQPIR